ncbi:helicase-exonuclease AddAB subunit AddA [Streptococcus sciuri]|uniref:ATP-dependent helicase/nuclease subunit A n=1 Tax=Streptococcus sciuri TaxID=2973939 RepID=A0ABT2F5G5_9STRE|nr:helicase-exonuclease AddAB subunit AddA [Streptococcus sciuri]MCS4487699.1 helicase-exonuclease AddAB subunit AddA [Streptococcus sciuri]
MKCKPFLTDREIKHLQDEESHTNKTQKRTPEQIEAIYANGTNILVSASAGSGKTFVMVERIIDQILRGIPIERLFISTFTVKAAGELKERLEKKLIEKIKESTDTDTKVFLSEQLAAVQNADIGTMDAFTQKLVSQYGYTLGISPTFRIMQDKNEQILLKNTVFSDLFSDYASGNEAELFTHLVKNFAGRSKNTTPFRSIVYQIHDFIQSTANPKQWLKVHFLRGAKSATNYDAIPKSDIDLLLVSMQETADKLQDVTDLEGYKKLTAKKVPTATYKKHRMIIEQLREWSFHFETLYGIKSLGRLAKDIFELIPKSSYVTVAGERYAVFEDLQDQLILFKHLDIILKYQLESLPMLELLQTFVEDFSDQYLQAKIQESAFEFSDINHFAIGILEKNPAIRALYRERYHEVMVDEYQDNNHMQERLLELLSNGHNRFMVGDIKQSIYRFRQADPQIFNQKFNDYQKHPEHGKIILLKENFRSQSEVIDSTNSLFSRLMDKDVGEIVYDESHELKAGSRKQKKLHPENKTQLLFLDTDQSDEILEENEDQMSPGEVRLVAKEIIRLHKDEGVPFSDITLLVSSRTRNDRILRSFEQYGIPLVTDGGEKHFLKSVEVMVMLDTLRAIDNPLNDYALVALLRSAMFQFDEDDLARLSVQSSSSQCAFFDKLVKASSHSGAHSELITDELIQKLKLFQKTFTTWRLYAKTHSLYDLIWKIYNDRFYYDYVGNFPRAEQRQANLYALALRANQFEQSGFKGLPRFIHMIDKTLENQNDLADVEVSLPKNAVHLMTIHKSKGLEFKYVFILNLDKKFSMTDLNAPVILDREMGIGIKYLANMKDDVNEEMLPSLKVSIDTLSYQLNKRSLLLATLSEQMRLLYVAMTRSEKKLYLIGKASASKWSDKYDGHFQEGRLALAERKRCRTFQDWFLALCAASYQNNFPFSVSFFQDEDLSDERIGSISQNLPFNPDNQAHNRQSDDIKQALDMLEQVDKLNHRYQAAIHLPSVQTPSQVKKFYEPIMDSEGVAVIDSYRNKQRFLLPSLTGEKVESTVIGSAMHELMQRLNVTEKVTMQTITRTLSTLSAHENVKASLNLDMVLAFFTESNLGHLIQKHSDKLYREAPFAMLKTDPVSQEQFVIRGIVDGYLLFEDRIVLFDYKTDKYTNSNVLVERYRGQMALYAEALSKSYNIATVDKYLVLLGGRAIEVVHIS